jgi:DNA-binding SARP family transcriptional activator/tetratricopeptide (TPR) repeat protein
MMDRPSCFVRLVFRSRAADKRGVQDSGTAGCRPTRRSAILTGHRPGNVTGLAVERVPLRTMTPPAHPRLEIRVLGPLEVLVDGAPLVVDTRKALAILALLAVDARPYARDELAALLWPDADDGSARGALRRTLSVLRASLGDQWLRVDRASVALDPAGTWVDLVALDEVRHATAAAALRRAAELARGSFLAGFSLRDAPDFDDWRATRASSAERAVAAILDRLTEAAEAEGDVPGAVAAAARRVDLDPLDESAQRRLMSVLARSGDRSGAIRGYRACVAVLERELGVTPLAETTRLYEAIRDARAEPVQLVAADHPFVPAVRVRLPHVGRAPELASVLGALASASPDGRVAAVTGEAGIGKSRLVEAIVEVVTAAGGRDLGARAFASEAGIAYGSIVELLRAGMARPDAAARLRGLPIAVLHELGRLAPLPDHVVRELALGVPATRTVDQPGAHARLLEAVGAALVALTDGPAAGLVVVEDLQWADDASREVLGWLARRLTGRPLLLLVTWRPEDLDELGASFASAIEAVPGSTAVALRRLGRDDAESLVEAAVAAGLPPLPVDALLAESEGLPLYLVEALAAGTSRPEGSARTVRALLRERLATVSQTAAQVLAAAAVIGRSFDLRLVQGASGRSEDETIGAVEELVRRGLVRELEAGPGTTFDFAHAKLREAAYEATSLARRRLLHRRTADLLRADGVSRDDLGRLVQIATHERAAGREGEAADAFGQAASRARALYANREAAAHLETALALGHPDLAGLQLALGEVRTALGDYAGAIAALETAAAMTTGAPLSTIEFRLGRVHARRGDLATADTHLVAAQELLAATDADSGDALAAVLAERALVAHRAGDNAAAVDLANRALEGVAGSPAAEELPGSAARPLQILGLVALSQGDLDLARQQLGRALRSAGATDLPVAVAARHALALVEAKSGELAGAIDLAGAALDDGRRLGDRHVEAVLENTLADLLHEAGRRDESMDHLKRAVAIFAEVGGHPGELEPEIWKLVEW